MGVAYVTVTQAGDQMTEWGILWSKHYKNDWLIINLKLFKSSSVSNNNNRNNRVE